MSYMLLSMGGPRLDGLSLQNRIEMSSMPVTECGCWIWLKSGTRLGYGQIKVNGKMVSAHRASWVAYRGAIPGDFHVLHSCDLPSCVNPDHLSLGTRSENQKQVWLRGRRSNAWKWSASLVRTDARKRVGFTLAERILRGSIPVTESGCWIWLGTTRAGYGRLSGWPRKQSLSAHRVSYATFVCAIPPGLDVLHRCDIRSCVNPDHLFVGTHADNMADRKRKRRYASWKGENHPQARLTASQVLEIRASSAPARDAASTFGVSKEAIKSIRARRCWRHI